MAIKTKECPFSIEIFLYGFCGMPLFYHESLGFNVSTNKSKLCVAIYSKSTLVEP